MCHTHGLPVHSASVSPLIACAKEWTQPRDEVPSQLRPSSGWVHGPEQRALRGRRRRTARVHGPISASQRLSAGFASARRRVCVHCPAGHRCDGLRDALPSRYPFSRRHDVACCEPRDPGLAWIHGGYVQCSAAVLCVTRLDAGPSFNVARTVALASSKAPDVYRRVISQEACRTVQLRTLHHAALIPFPSLAPVCIADVAAASCTISVCAPVARVPCRPLSSSADERWCRRWCCRKRDKSWEMTMTALRRLSFRSQHLR